MPAGREGARHQDQPRDGERQRPAAAHHGRHPVGRRSRPDHVVQQLHPSLRQQRRRPHRPRRGRRQARGRALQVLPPICSDGKMFMGMPWAVIGGMIAYRKSWFDEVGATKFPETWESYREVAKKLKAKGRPFGQTLGHTFGDAPGFTYPLHVVVGRQGSRGRRQDRGHQLQGDDRVGQVHDRPSGRTRMDEGGLAWDDTNNNRAFLSQTISATLNGASIYIEIAAQARPVQDREGRAAEERHPARAAAQGPGGPVRLPPAAVEHADEVLEEPGRREGVPEVDPHRGELREVVRLAEGLRHAVHGEVGERQAVGRRIRS